MANVSISAQNAATNSPYVASQGGSGVKAQDETGVLSRFSVKNWPFREAVLSGGKALADMIPGRTIETRTIGDLVDNSNGQDSKTTSDKYGDQKTFRTVSLPQSEEASVKPSVLKRDEPETGLASSKLAFSKVPDAVLTSLGIMALVDGACTTPVPDPAGRGVTTPRTTFPSGHTVVNWVNGLLLGFSAREASEVVVFNAAAYESLPESQQTTRSRIALAVTSGTTYLLAFVGGTAIVAGALGSTVKDDPKWANLIELLEGVAYSIGTRALYKMIKDLIARDEVLKAQITSTVSEGNRESSSAGTQNPGFEVELTGYSSTVAGDVAGGSGGSQESVLQEQAQRVIAALDDGNPEHPSSNNDSATQNRESTRHTLQKAIATLIVQQLREGGEVGLLAGLFIVGDEEPDASTLQKIEIAAISVALGSLIPVVAAGLGYGVTTVAEKCSNEAGGARLQHYTLRGVMYLAAAMMVGLAMKASHEFAEVLNADPRPYDLTNGDSHSIWSDKRLPMALASVFGYTPKPDVIQLIVGGCALLKALKMLHPLPAWLTRR